jgi:hypothetical protein
LGTYFTQVWSLAAGQQPWCSPGVASLPLAVLPGFDCRVLALSCCHLKPATASSLSSPAAAATAPELPPPPSPPHASFTPQPSSAPVSPPHHTSPQHTSASSGRGVGVGQLVVVAGCEEGEVACWKLQEGNEAGTADTEAMWRRRIGQVSTFFEGISSRVPYKKQ